MGGESKYGFKGDVLGNSLVDLDGIMAYIGQKECQMASKMEHVALLTWACRSTPLLTASTSGCGAGEGWRTLYTSASAWYHTGRNPWERSRLSPRSGVGLDIEKTTRELPDCYEEQGEDFSVQLCPLYSDDFASAYFPKQHLHLETENLNSYAIIKLNADKLSELRQAPHTHAAHSLALHERYYPPGPPA